MTNNRQFEKLAGRIDGLDRRVRSLTAPQLGNSSIHAGPGQSIDMVDPTTGQPVSSFGTQYDGTQGAVSFAGPTPPTPTPATVEGGPGYLSAGWDGIFVGSDGQPDIMVVAPLGFAYVEVHASTDPGFTAEYAATIIGTVNTARGTLVSITAPAGTYYVRLVARTIAGKPSTPSQPVQVVVEPPLSAVGGSEYVTGEPLTAGIGKDDGTPGFFFGNTDDPLTGNERAAGLLSLFGNGVIMKSRNYGDDYDARVTVAPSPTKAGGEIVIMANNGPDAPEGDSKIRFLYGDGAKLSMNGKNIETLPIASFANGFTNHPSGQPLTTSRTSATRVEISGMVNNHDVTNDVIIGTIAAGHRPNTKVFLPAVLNSGGANSFFACVVTIETDGTLRYRPPAGEGTGGYLLINGNYETA